MQNKIIDKIKKLFNKEILLLYLNDTKKQLQINIIFCNVFFTCILVGRLPFYADVRSISDYTILESNIDINNETNDIVLSYLDINLNPSVVSNSSNIVMATGLGFETKGNSKNSTNENGVLVKNEYYDKEDILNYVDTDNLASNIDASKQLQQEKQEQEQLRKEQEEKKAAEIAAQKQLDAGYLIAIDNPDETYNPIPWTVDDRYLLECLVTGEYGNDYLGAVLVAQTIRDTMVEENHHSVSYLIKSHKYSGRTNKGASDIAKRAVAFVFDQGGAGVQHKLKCFYASNLCAGKWHEKQEFVVQRNYVRFFYYR